MLSKCALTSTAGPSCAALGVIRRSTFVILLYAMVISVCMNRMSMAPVACSSATWGGTHRVMMSNHAMLAQKAL